MLKIGEQMKNHNREMENLKKIKIKLLLIMYISKIKKILDGLDRAEEKQSNTKTDQYKLFKLKQRIKI